MKKILIYSVLILFLVSCSQNADKKAQLEKLKAKREKLDTQISKLESEISPESAIKEIKPVLVKVTEMAGCVFNHYVQIQGTVDGDQNIAVSPQMSGTVTAVYVKEGSPVKKGQLLAELDAQILKQSLEEVNVQLDLAKNIFQKQSTLWEKNIGSEVQYLQAKTSKEALEKRVASINEQLKLTQITAPINGTIENFPLKVGQMASPGLPTSTIRIINMNVAKISAEVSEAYSARIKDGNKVLVSFPDIGKEIESKLNFTSRYIDPTNRTFKVECRISSNTVELRANMVANLKINDYTNETAFCLPINLIQKDQAGEFVYVAVQKGADWTAEKRNIKSGMNYDGTAEILEGLTLGDKVITTGFQNLNAGQKIEF